MCYFSTEADFSAHPVEKPVLDVDIQNNRGSIFYEFIMDIAINNDAIKEPEEYFLVVLDVRDFDPEKLEIDPSRRCARIRIKVDMSGK